MSLIGAIAGIFILIWGVYRGFNFIFMTFIASLIIALTSQMNIMEAIVLGDSSFVAGVGDFVQDYILIFLLSSIFAKLIDESGAAKSIAKSIINLTGREDPFLILVSIFIIGAVLTMGGISVFVALFVVIPLARPLFEEMDLPWYLVLTPYFSGVGTFTLATLPGSPQVQNIILGQALGTPLTAAPFISIVAAVAATLFTLWRIRVELNQAEEKGDGFEKEYAEEEDPDESEEDTNEPNVFISATPLVLLILAVIVGSIAGIENIIYYALAGGVLLAAILYYPYVDSYADTIEGGVNDSLSPLVMPAAGVGFGNVLIQAPGFIVMIEWMQELPISDVLIISIITVLIALAVGSATSTLGIVTESFLPLFDFSGTNLEILHRLLGVASINYPPHNSALVTFYDVSGLKYKDTYKNYAIAVHGNLLIQFVVIYLGGLFFA